MGNSDIIWDGIEADDWRILHADIKEAREDSLWSGTEFRVSFEGGRSVVDFVSDILIDTQIDITAFLGEELWMEGRTEEILLSIFFGMMKRADPFTSPSVLFFVIKRATGKHFELSLADGVSGFWEPDIGRVLSIPKVSGYTRLCLKIFDNIFKDRAGIVDRVADNGFNREVEFGLDEFEDGEEHNRIVDIGWFCDMPDGEFFFGVDDDMISEAPEVADLFLIRSGKDNHDTEPCIGRAFWDMRFWEAVFDIGFEIIFFNTGRDRARIDGEIFACNDTEADEVVDELESDFL